MAIAESPLSEEPLGKEIDEPIAPDRRRGRFRWLLLLLLLVLAGVLSWAWIERLRLADRLIADQLAALDLPATYEVERVSPQSQVLVDVVIGDPARPDLTIERVEVQLSPQFGLPKIGMVRLQGARLFGSYREGRLSFGSLDHLLFPEESSDVFILPDLVLDIQDGRGLIESDYGSVGLKAEGSGNLRGGFAGVLAANAPKLAISNCSAENVTLFSNVSINAERPVFAGPLRVSSLNCPDTGLSLANYNLMLDGQLDRTLDAVEGSYKLEGGSANYSIAAFSGIGGKGRYSWRDNALTADYDLILDQLDLQHLRAAEVVLDGTIRGRDSFDRIEVDGSVSGDGVRLGRSLDDVLARSSVTLGETLVGPMIEQTRQALQREGRNSRFAADLTLRKTGNVLSVVLPNAGLRGSSGSTLLSFSRLQLSTAGGAVPSVAGSFATGGRGIPQISGRIERGVSGASSLRMKMSPYLAEGGALAIPELILNQSPTGVVGMAGLVTASGALPGGWVDNLRLPLNGSWRADAGLALWRDCTTVQFDSLAYANLEVDRRNLRLCPSAGAPILRSDAKGTRFAAGTDNLDLTGKLGGTDIALKADAVGFAYPGSLAGTGLDIRMGEGEGVARFILPELTAELSGDLTGTFADAEARLAAVPLDISQLAGSWSYRNNALILENTGFVLEDREQVDRFNPMLARGAQLNLEDGIITADAVLREINSDREVVRALISHDLETGLGGADLLVENLVFDETLQPEHVSGLALGIVANTRGTVTGRGRIDWSADSLTSSGSFATDSLDFAAAFGPVSGASGTITFVDLLGMRSAPNQTISINSMNPGIEVEAGSISYQLLEDYQLQINRGEWPFLGGRLILRPALIAFGSDDVKRFTLELDGMDAARFVERMELANLAATGLFDGVIPLMFDEAGGHIESGRLAARDPGGNLSYVGELTYADLPAMGELAFDALKSLDYGNMDVEMNGSLDGEIVTHVKFDGIRQGAGASKNIVTREIAKLPIQFNVNIRAQFYELITTFRSMYDEQYLRDPRELGLIDGQGNTLRNTAKPELPAIRPEDLPGYEAPVQTSESENAP